MVPNSLLEVSGLPKSESGNERTSRTEVDSVNSGDHNEDTKAEVEENSDAAKPSEKVVAGAKRKADHLDSRPCRTVLNLKIWLAEHLGPELPINWIDAIPSESRAIIRMKSPRGASGAYDKLKKVFGDKPMIYDGCELSFRILEGDEEKEKWKKILDVQNRKGRRRHQKSTSSSLFTRENVSLSGLTFIDNLRFFLALSRALVPTKGFAAMSANRRDSFIYLHRYIQFSVEGHEFSVLRRQRDID
ncbi:unnamed protein product [Protopolystoma xenopodis]|uniref:XRRM domain-containing protein n=1 Tax=Protopolystoma xenopodis TaxID=117903 RepID=A0A448XF32_9PLAT|nr:unnamed protein product [Protopolystoma xenopodis]